MIHVKPLRVSDVHAINYRMSCGSCLQFLKFVAYLPYIFVADGPGFLAISRIVEHPSTKHLGLLCCSVDFRTFFSTPHRYSSVSKSVVAAADVTGVTSKCRSTFHGDVT